MTVPQKPGNAEEQGPGTRLVAAIAECTDVNIGARQAPALDTGEEVT